ncbi:MAG: MFS transporter [Deltaproteobacteria bacterium]|nr:MFS transporter [Deltaproteobacteria bacterium]
MISETSLRLRLLASSLFVLFIAQAFSASLTVSSFEKLYVNSLISSYSVVGGDFQKSVESFVRFGKPLEKLYGINRLIDEVKKKNKDVDDLMILLPDGKVLYGMKPDLIGTTLDPKIASEELKEKFSRKEQTPQIHSSLHQGKYHILLPIRNRDKDWIGAVDISFDEEIIQNRVERIVFWNLKVVAILTGAAALFMALLLYLFVPLKTFGRGTKARIYIILFLVMCSSQITYALINASFFRDNYIGIVHNKAQTRLNFLRDDVEYLLKKGIKIDRLVKMDVLLSEIIRATPEVKDIAIEDTRERILYMADRKGVVDLEKAEPRGATDSSAVKETKESSRYELVVPLEKKGEQEGRIRLHLSGSYIKSQIQEVLYDSLTVLIVSLLFVVELVIFLLVFIRRQLALASEAEPTHIEEELSVGLRRISPKTVPVDSPVRAKEAEEVHEKYSIIRPAAFMYLFATSLSVSFLPLHMANLYERMAGFYQQTFGLSRDIMLALPISAEMLFAGIGIIFAGNLTEKKGWQQPFFYGIMASAVGAFLSGMAMEAFSFIFFRAIMGLGYGLTWTAFQGFILSVTDTSTKARGIASLTAGIFSGIICGGATGGMLAERTGYAPVFLVAAGLVFLPLLIALFFLRDSFDREKKDEQFQVEQKTMTLRTMATYVFDRNVFVLLFFASIPSALCFVGFLYYATPIYLKAIGFTQSNIGRLIMVYGLSMIYLAPLVNKYVDRTQNKKFFIAIGGFLGGIGLAVFFVYTGFLAAAFAILMLGISSSVSLAAQTVFAVDVQAARKIGVGRAMGIYRFLQRMGQVLGPIVLGGMIAAMGVEQGMAVTGAAYIIFTILFLLMVKEGRESRRK